MKSSVTLSALLSFVLSFTSSVHAFNPTHRVVETGTSRKSTFQNHQDASFLLHEFKTLNGDVLDPYKILKISRSANPQEIQNSFRILSRKYHPDAAATRDILPGSCNNLQQVREHWELIRQSYEILSDPGLRHLYSRHEVLVHPTDALARAALDVLSQGIQHVGLGLLRLGTFAMEKLTEMTNDLPVADDPVKGVLEVLGGLFHNRAPVRNSHMWMEVDKETFVQVPL